MMKSMQFGLPQGTVAQWQVNEVTHEVDKTQLVLPLKNAEGNYIEVGGAKAAALIADGEVIYGATMIRNEYGVQQYANFCFFVTGFHGFHVFSGVVINIVILIMVLMGVMEKTGHYEMVEKTGLYWHFVDLVWVFVFTFYYSL